MGLETRCATSVDDADGRRDDPDARVLLEGDALIVRGHARATVPRATITDLSARDGVLTVTHAAGSIRLSLGDDAEKWRSKIAEGPRTRAQKLGIKPGTRVMLIEVNDPSIGRECVEAGAQLIDDHVRDGSQPIDLVLTEVSTGEDLARIPVLGAALGNGALWVIHPNGVPEVADTKIFAVAERTGMVSTKTMSFSVGMSAERLSVRKQSRTERPHMRIAAAR
jgi:hypothetical protein